MTDSPTRVNMNEAASNIHEYTVSELAFSLKRTVEEAFGRVRVRGELGRVVIAKSGHMYADIKDDKAVIAAVMWKSSVSRLPARLEEGMEVVVEGRLSTYPGRSQYQLILERLEPAGTGALMALLEKRKQQFAAEGLFDEVRKKPLPYLPQTIGVITSPTGAVIRDILHRLSDRFPRRVLLWPVLVQGDRAAEQITAAITGFDNMPESGTLPRPDVLIVARGGGSVEDLWSFNEEIVVRAAVGANIPILSAVGHETDWSLLDYVADMRAPTPTGAAEMAVPVRAELVTIIGDYALRLKRGLTRTVEHRRLTLAAQKLPKLDAILAMPRQRLDMVVNRLLPALNRARQSRESRFREIAARLRPRSLKSGLAYQSERLNILSAQAAQSMKRRLERAGEQCARQAKLLTAYSYQGVLARGYALVTDAKGDLVRSSGTLAPGERVALTFTDGRRQAVIEGKTKPEPRPPVREKDGKKQGDLF